MSNYSVVMHSEKGSTWKNHKYIRKEGNKYYYADSASTEKNKKVKQEISTAPSLADKIAQMENSQQSDTPKPKPKEISQEFTKKKSKSKSKSGYDLDDMARKVINGEFGNGAERQKRLGKSYKEIQKRVNDVLLRGAKLSTSKSEKGKKKVKSKHLKAKVSSVKVNM